MVKVFLDTNVLLDHALNRLDGEPEAAAEILELSESGALECFISQGSLYTLAYVIRKASGTKDCIRILQQYLSFVQIGSFDNSYANLALANPGSDLEDAFQYQTAMLAGCSFFITRNIRDFVSIQHASLPCLSPGDFLSMFLRH